MRSFIVCDVDVCCAGLIGTKGFFADSFLTITAGNSSETIDGKKIGLFATIGSIDGAQVAIDNDAEGIGFLKSDFLFAGRASLPSEDEQFMAYRAISKTMGTKVTNICMLDMLPEQAL